MQLLKRLKEVYSEDKNITNIFVYGSLVQPEASSDEFSDLDITILQKVFKPFCVDIEEALLLNYQVYGNMCFQELLLSDRHTADIAIFSEKEWKRKLSDEPEFYASSICLGIKSLVTKNNFISKVKIPFPVNPLIKSVRYLEIWQEFLSAYFSLVNMYRRKDRWRIYGYGVRLAEIISYIICLQAKISLYQEYGDSGEIKQFFSNQSICFANFNPLQIGRDFDKNATPRQKQIFRIIHSLTYCEAEKLVELYDLFAAELNEANDKYQLRLPIDNTEFLKKQIVSLLEKDNVSTSLKQKNTYENLFNLADDLLP